MEPSPSIAIIGGGPSGLIFARLLELGGITDYVVFERDASAIPEPSQQGGTLDLHPSSGQLALRRAGLFDEFSQSFARWDASCVHVVDPEGTTVFRVDDSRDAPEIDRLQLRQLLLDSLPGHKIRWGHAMSVIERCNGSDSSDALKGNGCTIRFTNGVSASGFRLIVGADGAWSKVRPLLTQAKPVYSGKMYIEGRLSHDNPSYAVASEIAGRGSMMAMGEYKKLAVQQVADGSYRVYFGLEVPEDFYQRQPLGISNSAASDHANDRTEVLRRTLLSSDNLATWAPQLKDFIENAEGSFRSWPLYRVEPGAVRWARSVAPGVTLLGDAAHVSTPFVGEGVNSSLLDAVILAERIIEHCGRSAILANNETAAALESAIAAYEDSMFARGQDLILRSTAMEAILFAQDASALFLQFVEQAKQGTS